MQPLKAYILCHRAESHSLYSPWISEIDYAVVEDYDHDWEPPQDCGVVVSHLHYDFPTAAILKRLTAHNHVPVLVLADGVLEFRNTFENPMVAAGSLFMPVHGHKIACIGLSQYRHLVSWGNQGKCELVGLPRLDDLKGTCARQPIEDEFRVLVMTARQPGFTERQLQQVQKSMIDLRNWFSSHPRLQGKSIQVIWRLTGDLDEKLGVESESEAPLVELLKNVDAVVTTPSTTILESMTLGLPTAVIDYTNSPKFVAAAWNISGPDHVGPVLEDLMNPSAPHLLYQQASYADSLVPPGEASTRMVQLVNQLIECCARNVASGAELELPEQMLNTETIKNSHVAESISLASLFPGQIGFRSNELESLTTQYDQLCREVSVLQGKIDQQRAQLAQARQDTRMAWRHHDYAADQVKWLRAEIQRLNLALRISRRPTRLDRRLKVRASIAFQRWQYFVDQVQRSNRIRLSIFKLGPLFEKTRFPKGVKLPATVKNFETNKRKNPQIKMWKQKPANALLRRINLVTQASQKRLRARRVMSAR